MSVFKTRRQLTLVAALASAAAAAAIGVAAGASAHPSQGNGSVALRAYLTGFQEVPSLNSPGRASLRATMTPSQITFTLTYANLSAPPTMAHIHVGQPGVDGGVSVFFCGGGSKPACPPTTSGTVSGTIVPADVIGRPRKGSRPVISHPSSRRSKPESRIRTCTRRPSPTARSAARSAPDATAATRTSATGRRTPRARRLATQR